MLLFLLTLFIGKSCLISAESDSVTSLISGIDEVSAALVERNGLCSPEPLSEKLEENLSGFEGLLERQWDMIAEAREAVLNASKRTQDLEDHYYVASPTDAPDACAEPFKRAAGSCFWMHKNPGLNWEDARAKCQQEGADLATPQDIQGVMEFLKREHGHDWVYIWLGGSLKHYSGWTWLDTDVRMDIDSSLWFENDRSGRCAAFNGGRGYRIMRWDCSDDSWYLCEKKIES